MCKRRKELMKTVSENAFVSCSAIKRPNIYVQAGYYYKDLTHGGLKFYGEGFSKVRHPDIWNEDYGFDIAYKKAVAHIVKKIMAVEFVEDVFKKENE